MTRLLNLFHQPDESISKIQKNPNASSLQAITASALFLPGILQYGSGANAAEVDSVDFQYSHYQEGRRDGITGVYVEPATGAVNKYARPNNRNPIEVESLHGSARISLSDRVRFAFNYIQDTWSGATPYGSAPEQSGANGLMYKSGSLFNGAITDAPIKGGASPMASSATFLDTQGNSYYKITDPITGQTSFIKDRPVHVLSYASPETRKQGDFKLSYEWDNASFSVGGGVSTERDYDSRFGNVGLRMDFNQKQTTVNLGLSYTNSDINAVIEPHAFNYITSSAQKDRAVSHPETLLNSLESNRQDWGVQLDLTQIINQDSLIDLGMGYTRSTGFLENPYKFSWFFYYDPANPDPNFQGLPPGITFANGAMLLEQRPEERNLFNWKARWTQYVEPLEAALHLGYSFAHDDWGINAHTFDADWVQPLGKGWSITPRIRYYSQEAADFYQPFFKVRGVTDPSIGLIDPTKLTFPDSFSSDQRLSGYGALSGGVTIAKEFAKGIGLEVGFEYYSHQGNLKLGGNGEGSFADFDYWVANAALKFNLDALAGDSGYFTHEDNADISHYHANIPAGVLFGHTLSKAGQMMVGYRYQHAQRNGDYLNHIRSVSDSESIPQGCPGSLQQGPAGKTGPGCTFLPREMAMNMHMLELMVAPTDWLTLMLMPQFMDMQMEMDMASINLAHNGMGHRRTHETGGIGDTGMYALIKLFDTPHHHLHTSLGFSAPSGDVGIKRKESTVNKDGAFIDYGMQLGSGTWDFKPSLTYLGKAEAWSWGAQAAGILRLEEQNKAGYALGDLFEASVWGGYDLTRWLSATIRASYTWQGAIKGRYFRRTDVDADLLLQCKANSTYPDTYDQFGNPGPSVFHQDTAYQQCLIDNEEQKKYYDQLDRPSSSDFPANYGGHYVDVGFGLSATVPSGSLAGNTLSFEWLQPVYTDVNGYQLDRDGALSFTWSYGF